jgi:DNA primase
MSDAAGQVVGIRLRGDNGRKWAVPGSREGLFLPAGLTAGGRLLVCEGATDTAACLDWGFPAIGRPSCTGGVRHLVELVKRLVPTDVVVVADADAPGQRGAENLARQLVAYCPTVRVIAPSTGIKDARAWLQAGATAADVLAAIGAAPVRRLKVTTAARGR